MERTQRGVLAAGAVTAGLIASSAGAQPVALTVNFPQNTLTTTATETFPGSNVWDFDVDFPTSTEVTANILEVVVTANDELDIRTLDIGGAGQIDLVRVRVEGFDDLTGEALIDDLSYITRDGLQAPEFALDFVAIDGNILSIAGTNEVGTMEIGGDLGKLVVEPPQGAPGKDPLLAGSVANIVAEGNIGTTTAVPDPGIFVKKGSLGPVQCNNLSGTVSVEDQIVLIEAVNSGATITTTEFDEGAGLGSIHRLRFSGNFVGSVETGAFTNILSDQPELQIHGDFRASSGSFETERIVVHSALPAEGTYFIGGAFGPRAEVVLPDGGLPAQFLINREGGVAGGAEAAWDDDPGDGGATIPPARFVFDEGGPNELVLSGADYDVEPSALGGGSVGAAPYLVNGPASAPSDESVQFGFNTDPPLSSVTAAYYGPLRIDTGQGVAATVERRVFRKNYDSAEAFQTAPGTFDVSVAASSQDRDLVVTATSGPGFEWGYEYRIVPGDGLLAKDTASEPAIEDALAFSIAFDCLTDIAGTNFETDSQDLAELINAWGTSDPQADFPDASGQKDGIVNNFDLGVLLAGWGPCGDPPDGGATARTAGASIDRSTSAGRSGSGGAFSNAVTGDETSGSPMLDSLGFESMDAYMAYLQALTDEELAAHLVELLEVAQNL